jgi:hypothetical protein
MYINPLLISWRHNKIHTTQSDKVFVRCKEQVFGPNMEIYLHLSR